MKSAARRSKAGRATLEESSHMSVLGMDGVDHDIQSTIQLSSTLQTGQPIGERNGRTLYSPDSEYSLYPTESASKHDRSSPAAIGEPGAPLISDTKRSENRGETHHSPSLNHMEEDPHPKWWRKNLWGAESKDYNARSRDPGDGFEDDDCGSHYQSMDGAMDNSNGSHIPNGPTAEEKLKQECTFFYQGMEDVTDSTAGRRGLSTLHPGGLQRLSTALNQMPRLSRQGARFHSKYEQLNQDISFVDRDDLLLEENSQDAPYLDVVRSRPRNAIHPTSSLCYEQNGRLLMTLPRDQVRLVMDQDLEPGIISVEQWRKAEHCYVSTQERMDQDEAMRELEEGNVTKPIDDPPALRYVMTVPDDLYRRVVAEMSYGLQPPCCGFFSNGDGRVDIRLALLILSVILLLMFIITMYWPTE